MYELTKGRSGKNRVATCYKWQEAGRNFAHGFKLVPGVVITFDLELS